MRFCSGITKSGTRCTHSVSGSAQFCHLHDPAKSKQRKRIASKAGKSRPSKVLLDLRSRLVEIGEDVLEGKTDTKRASVAAQAFNVAIRCVEAERKLKESEEFEARLEALEEATRTERELYEGRGRWR